MLAFKIDRDKELVTVICGGSLSSKDREKVLDRLVEFLKINPNFNLFLDVSRADLSMNEDEQIEYGHLLASKKEYFNMNRAAVLTNNNTDSQSLFLLEAYSEGLYNFLEFSDRNEALEWVSGEIK